MSKYPQLGNYYESKPVVQADLTLDWVEEKIKEAREFGATQFRLKVDPTFGDYRVIAFSYTGEYNEGH